MSTSINELIGTFYEALSGKAELLDAVITDDWDDIPLGPGQEPGRAGARSLIEGLSKVFSDFRVVVEEIIDARGDRRKRNGRRARHDARRPHRRVLRHRADRSRGRGPDARLPPDRGRPDRPHPSHGGLGQLVPAGRVLAIQLNRQKQGDLRQALDASSVKGLAVGCPCFR